MSPLAQYMTDAPPPKLGGARNFTHDGPAGRQGAS